MTTALRQRRFPIGTEWIGAAADFRVWAPRARTVSVRIDQRSTELKPDSDGYFSGVVPCNVGDLYRFQLDDDACFPDPASRFQPDGPHGPSQIVDASSFRWTDGEWRGSALQGQVIYELHIGTFTPEGTWAAAERELPALADLGITLIEVMPVNDFAGRWGWGYDGVNLFAPTRLYGSPDDMRRFVNRAHALGIGVILDVVYNHLGPDGNYLAKFSPDYFTDRHKTDWGEAINFDGPNCTPVREFFAANAGYWIDEFHLDGLRLDATQNIYDDSKEHILKVIGERVRAAARGRSTIIVAENEPQHVNLVRPASDGGYGLDALWNDDYHHTARVALTGRREAYYMDYGGSAQELVSALKHGYLYQGQLYRWQKKPRGTSSRGVSPAAFVAFLENHDQVANSGNGRRIHQLASPGRYRALTALTLLGPGTPMLFQGQEFAASSPFLYFADHHPEVTTLLRKGRSEFLAQFPSLAPPDVNQALPDPGIEATFRVCKLDFRERETHANIYRLHRDLIRLRHDDPVFRSSRPGEVDGAVLGPTALVLRFFGAKNQDRLLVVNLGVDLHMSILPEPLLAPPAGRTVWKMIWSSESACYGTGSTPPIERDDGWHLPGESAVVLA